MRKIPTIFPKDPEDLGRVLPADPMPGIDVFRIKVDGTACLIKDGKPYCRYDAKLFRKKRGRLIRFTKEEVLEKLPEGAIACQEPDELSGHWPHWIPVREDDPSQKYILEGFENLPEKIDGTYECVGPKLRGNPHGEKRHIWIPHFSEELLVYPGNHSFDHLKNFLADFPFEGLVAYDENGTPIGKIRRSDFGHPPIEYRRISPIVFP